MNPNGRPPPTSRAATTTRTDLELTLGPSFHRIIYDLYFKDKDDTVYKIQTESRLVQSYLERHTMKGRLTRAALIMAGFYLFIKIPAKFAETANTVGGSGKEGADSLAQFINTLDSNTLLIAVAFIALVAFLK